MAGKRGMTRVVTMPSRGQVTIPLEFRRRLNLDEGTVLAISLEGQHIEIRPIRAIQDNLREYSREEIDQFLAEDRVDPDVAVAVRQLLASARI